MDINKQLEEELVMFVTSKTNTFSQLKELVLKSEPIEEAQKKIAVIISNQVTEDYNASPLAISGNSLLMERLDNQAKELFKRASEFNYDIFRKQLFDNSEKLKLTPQEKIAVRVVLKHMDNVINKKNELAVLEERMSRLTKHRSTLSDTLGKIQNGDRSSLCDINEEYQRLFRDKYQLGCDMEELRREYADGSEDIEFSLKVSAVVAAISAVAALALGMPLLLLAVAPPILLPLLLLSLTSLAVSLVVFVMSVAIACDNDECSTLESKNRQIDANDAKLDELEKNAVPYVEQKLKENDSEMELLATKIEDTKKAIEKSSELARAVDSATVINGANFFNSGVKVSTRSDQPLSKTASQQEASSDDDQQRVGMG